MTESAFFFPHANYQLFGFLHKPKKGHRDVGIVFCAPFGEEKQESHRTMVNFARLLAQSGFYVLRFDYYGTGDSQGEWQEATWESHLSDISSSFELLRSQGCKQIGLLGLRLGGTLARFFADQNPIASFLVLWEPIINVREYLFECMRANLTTQMTQYGKIEVNREQLLAGLEQGVPVNLSGYLLTKAFYEQAKTVNLLEMKPYYHPSMLVHIQKTMGKHAPYWPDFAGQHPHLKSLDVETEIQHFFWNEPIKFHLSYYEKLFDLTLKWFMGISDELLLEM